MIDRQLSPNFALSEFVRSEVAARNGIELSPPPSAVSNLDRLANNVLEHMRELFTKPVIVTSGYRSPAVNRLVGGAMYSDHLTGSAADFHVLGMDLDYAWTIAKQAILSLPVNQLILEYGQWIHVSVAPLGSLPLRHVIVKPLVQIRNTSTT